jgi:hypothetical protein
MTDAVELPFPSYAAVCLPGQLQFNPVEVLAALTEELRRAGGLVIEGARVTGVSGRTSCEVITSAGRLTADNVVLATGIPFLDRGPVAAVAGLLLGRKLADIERTHAPLPLGQLGVGLPLAAQLLNQAVVFRAELAAQPRPPHLSRGHDYDRHHDDDSDDDSYNCSGRHYDLREVSERHSDSPR